MKKFVADQQEEVCKAIIGTGQYVLKEKYKHFAVSPCLWFTSFTTEQKNTTKRKFQKAAVVVCEKSVLQHGQCENDQILHCEGDQQPHCMDDQLLQGDDDQPPHYVEDSLPQHDDDQPLQQKDVRTHLSVDILYALHQTGVPTLILQHMWSKAAELLLNNQVTLAPGCLPFSRMVASKSNTRPHLVSLNKDGRYECDDTCPSVIYVHIV